MNDPADLSALIRKAPQVCLFLDYDGTLADFAPNPDVVIPDEKLITLLDRLIHIPNLRLVVISGRRLDHVQRLVPLEGVLRGGTYGLELDIPGKGVQVRADYDRVRPTVELALNYWRELIPQPGEFYVEDKGWAVALHAPAKRSLSYQAIYEAARHIVNRIHPDPALFAIRDDNLLLELAPLEANKASSLNWILNHEIPANVLPVSVGDDAHDEAAFAVVQAAGGLAVRVGKAVETHAEYRLENPAAVRVWLKSLSSSE